MISGSEWRAFDRNSLRWASVLPQLGNSNRLFVSMITIVAIPVLYIYTHIQTYAFTFSNRCVHFVVVFGIWCRIYSSHGSLIPYLTPSPRTTRGQQNGLLHIPPSRYGPSFPRFKISGRHQNSLLQIVLPKLQHSKLFFFFPSPLYQTYHTNRNKNGRKAKASLLCHSGEKKKKKKGLFLPPAAKVTVTPV